MQLVNTSIHDFSLFNEFSERMATLNMHHYASEAASKMKFDSIGEMNDSIKRAMDLCLSAGIPIKANFQHVYKGYDNGLTHDWKLSELAYYLVCLNGNPSNPHVAVMNIKLISDKHLNHF